MTATFQSLRDTRLPKACKAISLLGNLVRYAHTEQEAKDLVNELSDEIDEIDAAFGTKWGWDDTAPPQIDKEDAEAALGWIEEMHNLEMGPATTHDLVHPAASPVPPGTADGGASFDAEVRWALDALKRGDVDLAENRLRRVLNGAEQ